VKGKAAVKLTGGQVIFLSVAFLLLLPDYSGSDSSLKD